MRRIRNVVNFLRLGTQWPQQIPFTAHSMRQETSTADTHHLCAACLLARLRRAWNMRKIFGPGRVGHVDDRSPVWLYHARERVHHAARMVTNVGNLTPFLIDNDRLIRRSPLQIAESGEFHIPLRLLVGRIGSRLLQGWFASQSDCWNTRPVRRKTLCGYRYWHSSSQQ